MATAIKVENLSKIYRLGEIGTGTISRDIERFFKTKILKQEDPFLKIGETNDRATKGASDLVYSLKDINFEIEQGDAVGIIGRNGAGKSTLLKILSRVTSPTTGKINIKGRVASLLEVGTGFHPELTGRDNIYLNGAILGMRKREIDCKLDEIIDFSGVERYIDTPVKRYSSGMYVRLAFAVAAHLESEILIVDEVLAVGDAEFQKKCLGKMGEVSKGEGKTVLFVSHQLDSITRLCNSSLFFENGQLIHNGDVDKAIKLYYNKNSIVCSSKKWAYNKPGNNLVELNSVKFLGNGMLNKEIIDIAKSFEIIMEYEVLLNEVKLTPGINLFNESGDHIFSSHDVKNAKNHVKLKRGVYVSKVTIPGNLLSEGLVSISVAMMSYDPFIVHFHEKEVLSISINDMQDGNTARGIYVGKFPGIIRPLLEWETKFKK